MTLRAISSPRTAARRWVAFCLDVAFPPVCARCGRVGAVLCATCLSLLEPVPPPICPHCGRHLSDAKAACDECARHPLVLRQMRAPLLYVEPTASLIHRMKYDGYFALAAPLGEIMAGAWPDWEQPPDLIVPIPLHARRQRRRGYNQSERLARPLAAARGLPLNPAALRRERHTAPQVGLGPREREENVRDAFAADDAAVDGRHVLLVDDVLTTGATMKSAAGTLLAAGAASVSAYCLARVA